MTARLRVVSSELPGRAGTEVELEGGAVEIGRSAECAVRLDEPGVSRRHARIEGGADGYTLVDLESANGIFLGERRVEHLRLEPGLRFRIGATLFEFEGDAPSEPPPPSEAETLVNVAKPASGGEFLVRIVESKGGEPAGREFRVAAPSALIGRDEACAVALPGDASVSHQHARLEPAGPGRWRVTDLGSANGVWVGERRVSAETLEAGQRFRIGDCFLECRAGRSAERPTSATQAMSDLGDLMAKVARRKLEAAGEAQALGGSRAVLLDDPRWVYYVVSGKVEVFTATVQDGRPIGGRSHFVTVAAGNALFGIEAGPARGSGFLAVGNAGTELRRVAREDLPALAAEPPLAAEIVAIVDGWISALAARLTRDVFPRPEVGLALEAGHESLLDAGQRARAGRGVVWVALESQPLLFVGMSTLAPRRPGARFPLTPQTWVEPEGAPSAPVPFLPRDTAELLAQGGLWEGLDHFHEVLCECEFINKRLAVVDEYQRLDDKARESEAARDAAYDAIGAVLAGRPGEPAAGPVTGHLEPVLQACVLVGRSLGLDVQAPPEAPGERSFNDHVAAIAAASRLRIRRVALRGDWWRSDAGPLLACDEQGAPLALLPRGPRAYTCVDVLAGTGQRLTAERAQGLSPFAFCFYRPLPSETRSPWALMSFGLRGLAPDLWTLVAMGLLGGMLGALAPLLVGQMIDRAIPQGERGLLVQMGLGMLFAALAGTSLNIVKSVAVVRVESRMDLALQAALWDRLLELPAGFFRQYGAGDLAERAGGINTIRGLLSQSGVSGILGALGAVAYLALMLALSPALGLVGLAVALLLVAFTTLGSYLLLRNQRREVALRGQIASLVLQLIAGVAKVRVSGAENHAFRVWAQRFSEQKRLSFSLGRLHNVLGTSGAGFQVLAWLVIFAAVHHFQSGVGAAPLSTGRFVAFLAAFGSFVAAVQGLANAALGLLASLPFYERLAPILTTPPESDESRARPGRLDGEIAVSHVNFRYHADAPWVLKDVSFKIAPGEFVAFVGASGCGKSTLLRLLLGFERPASGAVHFDGQDLAHLDVRAVRRQVGVVLQESRLLPTDIFRNIVGNSSRTAAEAWEAVEMAGLGDDIREMPMGLHTVVSEGGGTFSGGQRQRLLIARALVSKPRIIFFDEATSALDNKAQAVVTQSMDRLNATRIVIAHRLSTVVNVDRILYLEGGEIREQGTYAELMARNGLFAQLARRQMA